MVLKKLPTQVHTCDSLHACVLLSSHVNAVLCVSSGGRSEGRDLQQDRRNADGHGSG